MNTEMKLRKLGSFSTKLLALVVACPWAFAAPQTKQSLVVPQAATTAEVEEVVVTSRRESDYSVITEQAQKIVEVPGALGDPLMAAFSLPGVLAKGESGSPAVRGSSPSDNRYMVDGVPAGYVFHQFSTSIFNENIIQDFQLYSAGFGPNYANAIGGVFDIRLRDPKHQDFSTKLDLGMLRTGLFLEGEVTEDSAIYLSARKSMLQYFVTKEEKEEAEKEDGIIFQDVPQDSDYQLKYVMDFSGGNKWTISANGASDLASGAFTEQSNEVQEQPDFEGDAKIQSKFKNFASSFRHDSTDGINAELSVGEYRNENNIFWGDRVYHFNISQNDRYVIGHIDYLLADTHNLSLGGEWHDTDYEYNARFVQYLCTEANHDCALRRGDLITAINKINVRESMVYLNDHFSVGKSFSFDVGGQVHRNNLTKENIAEPRLAATWKLSDRWSINTSAGAYDRLPDIDKIFPESGNPKLKSPTSNHYTLGVKEVLSNGWSWTATSYYKTMELLPLANSVGNAPTYTNQVSGRAYGLEIFLNKELINHWYGWLAVSTSRSFRTDETTQKETPYYLDTPIVVNAVLNYKTGNWTFGGRFMARTGEAYTPITGVQSNPAFKDHWLPVYGEAFSENLPYYARLDLRVKKETTFWRHSGEWTLDILNATNRRNVDDRHLNYKRTKSPTDYQIVDTVGLGLIVAAGMSVTF